MFGNTTLSEVRQRLREAFQGNAEVKSWLDHELAEHAANGTPVSSFLLSIQGYVEGEPIPSTARKRTRPTARGKRLEKQLTDLISDLEAELAKSKPAAKAKSVLSRRNSATTKKTRKRTTVST